MVVNRGEARERLLDAAEQLFARHGVEGVSLRSINAAAGVGPSILHYHFGTIETLLEAIISRRMDGLMEQRLAMLQHLKEQGDTSVRAVIEAMVLPLANFAIEHGDVGIRYVRLIARLFADRNPALLATAMVKHAKTQQIMLSLLQRSLPDLSKKILTQRLDIAGHTMLHTLADLGESGSPGLSKIARRQRVEHLIDFICAGISAPPRDINS